MGIAGAGNSGTLLATLFAPRLAERYGWSATFALAAVPVVVVLVLFACLAKDSPRRVAPVSLREYGRVLRDPDTLWPRFLFADVRSFSSASRGFLTPFFHSSTAGIAGPLATSDGRRHRRQPARPLGGGSPIASVAIAFWCCCSPASACASVRWGRSAPCARGRRGAFVGAACWAWGTAPSFSSKAEPLSSRIGMSLGGRGGGRSRGLLLPSLLGGRREVTGSYAMGWSDARGLLRLDSGVALLGARCRNAGSCAPSGDGDLLVSQGALFDGEERAA